MRTKALLLTAALGAAGVATSMAQVYSVNAVGYINVVCTPGQNLIANQLNASPNNHLNNAIPPASVPDGTRFAYFDPNSGYSTYVADAGEWQPPPAANITLGPGQGGFVFNPNPSGGANITLTFVGEVPQGNLVTPLTGGGALQIVSSQVPQQGNLDQLEVSPASDDGDLVQTFDNIAKAYSTYVRDAGEWQPPPVTGPTIQVGQAFFYRNSGANSAITRNFSVN